jgi:hypothetical protein
VNAKDFESTIWSIVCLSQENIRIYVGNFSKARIQFIITSCKITVRVWIFPGFPCVTYYNNPQKMYKYTSQSQEGGH